MKVVFTDPITFAISTSEKSKASIQPTQLDHYWSTIMRQSGRAAIYGWPTCLALWVFIVFPDVGLPSNRSELYAFFLTIPFVFLLIFLHEIVHLLALPNRIFRAETYLAFDLNKPLLKMGLYTRIGGRITREQFIWISLLPFILLTVIPFGFAVFAETKPSIVVGLLASANFGLSTADLMQSAIVFWEARRGQVLREA
ncbi:MAG: DUF3267 domain-containing protein [Burkholderiales bacterium]